MRRITARATLAAALVVLPGAVHSEAGAPASRNTLVVSAYEYSFQAPDSIPAGVVTVRLIDRGKASHQLNLARLDDSSSLSRVMQTLVEDKVHTGGIRWVGGVESAIPGESSETILALKPGRYVVVCAFDGPTGRVHMSMGMIRALVVTAATTEPDMTLPPAPVTIRLSDYHLAIAGTLRSGKQLVRVENIGAHRHHLNLTRIRKGATVDEIMKWDGKSLPAPLEDMSGGVSAIEPGEASVISLNLKPGRYELACIMSDDGKSTLHYMLGMHDEITIR
ncbi:MAG: hypothetical protein ABI889_06815 [Gemmatimonadota bacterium]